MTVTKQTQNQTLYEIIQNTKRLTVGESAYMVNEYIKTINEAEKEVFGRARTPEITEDEIRRARLWRS